MLMVMLVVVMVGIVVVKLNKFELVVPVKVIMKQASSCYFYKQHQNIGHNPRFGPLSTWSFDRQSFIINPAVDIDNLFLIFIFIYPSFSIQSMTKSFPFVRIVFIEYLNILYCRELFHFYTFIDRQAGRDRRQKDITALLGIIYLGTKH